MAGAASGPAGVSFSALAKSAANSCPLAVSSGDGVAGVEGSVGNEVGASASLRDGLKSNKSAIACIALS